MRTRFLLGLFSSVLFLAPLARALPSFARQTNLQCIVCHTEFPELTAFGHQFKLNGYTLSANDSDVPPIAFMIIPAFTHTSRAQEGGAAPHFGDNNNWEINQASVFYAGRLFGPYADRVFGAQAGSVLNKFGIFFQTTYDGTAKDWAWDNAELRYADHATIHDSSVTYGFYLNNNPSMQDVWNTTPAWGFPFSSSSLAPTPAAATLIDGGLAQEVGGVGAYAMLDNHAYFDFGAYRTLGPGFQKSVGVDPSDETQVTGAAPYWRLAYEWTLEGNARWEIGTFGLAANSFPGRDSSAGHDRTLDWGFDSEYQNSFGLHDLTLLFSYIREKQTWNASQALALTSNSTDDLWTAKITADYLFDKTYGFGAQYFTINGDNDPTLYSDSVIGSPRSDGFIFELRYLPLNKGGGPSFWPKSNVKFTLQYTYYIHFDGASHNYNGTGRNARDNNTTYLEAWIMF